MTTIVAVTGVWGRAIRSSVLTTESATARTSSGRRPRCSVAQAEIPCLTSTSKYAA